MSETALSRDALIGSYLRVVQELDAATVVSQLVRRVMKDSFFAARLTHFVYATRSHYSPRLKAIDWSELATRFDQELTSDSRISIGLEDSRSPTFLTARINCESEIVDEVVDGKKRSVPKASDRSTVGISLPARMFALESTAASLLELFGDLAVITQAQHGYASHHAVVHGTDFDQAKSDRFDLYFLAWANVLGPNVVAEIGRDRVMNTPAEMIRELSNGGVLMTMSASPMQEREPDVQARIAAAKKHLGLLSPSDRASAEELQAYDERVALGRAKATLRFEQVFRDMREQLREEMERQADGCVVGVLKFMDAHLDYTAESLATVSRLVFLHFRTDESAELRDRPVVQAFGAYCGEVVRRSLGGVWSSGDVKGQPVLLNVDGRDLRVDPFEAVAACIEHHGAKGYRMEEWYAAAKGSVDT